MDGLPVVIRLLDPPLHEFLPDYQLSAEVAVARRPAARTPRPSALLRGRCSSCTSRTRCSASAASASGSSYPELFAMQVQAIAEAPARLSEAGHGPQPEIMVPLVATVKELAMHAWPGRSDHAQVSAEDGVPWPIMIGTMIELPVRR